MGKENILPNSCTLYPILAGWASEIFYQGIFQEIYIDKKYA